MLMISEKLQKINWKLSVKFMHKCIAHAASHQRSQLSVALNTIPLAIISELAIIAVSVEF